MNLEARIAIEALRAGVPNRAAVRLMGTDEPALEQAFEEQLQRHWDNQAKPNTAPPRSPNAAPPRSKEGFGIAGGFGSGKSHFLGYLAEVVRTHGFVVSRVVVSKETSLYDPARVFEAAVRSAVLPDRHDDAISGAMNALRQSRDRMAALEAAVAAAGDALAPLFTALLHLVRRETLPPPFNRQIERFLAGGRIRAADIRNALTSVGETRKFDLRMPAAAALTEQRIRFLSMVFHAAGYTGWCLLFDEVELIGRYTPLRRALAYAQLAVWLGLDGVRAFPGIVAVYAITDDFVTAVIEDRQDETRLEDRLRLKGRNDDARLAVSAMRHIARTVRSHRLRAPGAEELVRTIPRLRAIYRDAYGWEPPAPAAVERTATRTMRQYVKGWITEWDMRRLTGETTRIVAEEITANYTEDDSLSMPPEPDGDQD